MFFLGRGLQFFLLSGSINVEVNMAPADKICPCSSRFRGLCFAPPFQGPDVGCEGKAWKAYASGRPVALAKGAV